MAGAIGRLTVDAALDAITGHLTERGDQIARMASFGNSFEAWLKFEVAALFAGPPWSREPWLYRGDRCEDYGWIGLEWRTKLTAASDAAEDRTKLVDFWVCETGGNSARSHYFEFKLIFDNANANKMIFSWVEDLLLMCQLNSSIARAASYNALALAVGWDPDAWRLRSGDHLRRIEGAAASAVRRPTARITDAPRGGAVLLDVLTVRPRRSQRRSSGPTGSR